MNRLLSWLHATFRRSRTEALMSEELRFHIESYSEDLVRSGFSAAEAERRARAEFGAIEAHKEGCREGTGLFVRTLEKLKSASLGFRPERILLFSVDAPRTRYAREKRASLFLEIEQRLQAIPGVEAATASQNALVANSSDRTGFGIAGKESRPGGARGAWINEVGDSFFQTMGIPILYGRGWDSRDHRNSPLVAVVNQQFVRQFFPDTNPLGRRLVNSDRVYEIVGVCGDAHFNDVRTAPPATFYGAFAQAPDLREMTFELKTAASEVSIMKSVRQIVASIDKDLPVLDVRTQAEQIDATLVRERLFAALASGFGVLALILASIGVYGLMAYAVARRTNEIGVRMAIGAQQRQVLTMILREVLVLAAAGIGIGVLAAFGLTRYVRSMLYGLTSSDPVTFGGTMLLLGVVVLAAGWWPAQRASRLDPMAALRHE